MSYEIRTISGLETLALRRKVLRPFESEGLRTYPENDLPSSFHFGVFVSSRLVAVASFILEKHPEFLRQRSYRLRGMAVDQKYQGQGFGRKLLAHAEEYLKKQDCDFIWLSARESAFRFYEKSGFTQHGPLYEMPSTGPHKVMYKNINPS